MAMLGLALNKSYGIWFLSLAVMILFLPLFEAPKTISLILFYLIGFFSIWKRKGTFSFDKDDIFICFWMVSGYVVALFAGLHHKEWGGAFGVLELALLLFLVKHNNLDNKMRYLLCGVVLISTMISDLEGLWALFVSHKNKVLELNSVGHVNHSAIYLCVSFGVALAMSFSLNKRNSVLTKLFVLVSLFFIVGSIVISDSRATVVTMILIVISMGYVSLNRNKIYTVVSLFMLIALISAMIFGNATVVQKQIHYNNNLQTTEAKVLGARAPIWNSAMLAFRQFPIFGLGIRNFGAASTELQQNWALDQHKSYSQPGQDQAYKEDQYLPYAHAHSFYFATLAEQGVFGFGITMILMLRICFLLYKYRPQVEDDSYYWMIWSAAFATMQVILINGLLNTTFHHEHGLLSVVLIGLWWSSLKERAQS